MPASPTLHLTRRRAPAPRPRAVDVLAGAAGLGLGAAIALALAGQPLQALSATPGQLILAGRLTGMVGAYALLVAVLLAARLPVLERTLGQDRLIAWHRGVAPVALGLVLAHVATIVAGSAAQAQVGAAAEAGRLIAGTPGMLAATAATGLLVAAGVTSYRRARRRLSHETWWAIHLYTYLGLSLSLSHQLTSGAAFASPGWARPFWIALWAGTAGVVVVYRVMLPLARSAYHRLRVESVVETGPGTVSVTLRGRALHRLPVSGGQFLNWRFLRRGLWWQAHPYSLSALPTGDRLRITVRDLGDHSRAIARLAPGTRVAFEGPYGAFTRDHARARRTLLVAGGVGATPVRALLEDLPAGSEPTVVLRARRPLDIPHLDEIGALARGRGGQVLLRLGSRDEHPLDAPALRRLVPHIADCDVYVCGSDGLAAQVRASARACGVPAERLHCESFTP